MNVHGPLEHYVGSTRIHHVQHTVDRELDAGGVEPHLYTLALEDGLYFSGYILIFVSNQARCPFYNCHVAAKTPENLTILAVNPKIIDSQIDDHVASRL